MNKLELQKTANEVRKGIVTAVHSAKAAAVPNHETLYFCTILIIFRGT